MKVRYSVSSSRSTSLRKTKVKLLEVRRLGSNQYVTTLRTVASSLKLANFMDQR